MRPPKNVLLRCAAVLAAGLGIGLAFAAPAGAATPQPVSSNELSKATNAAHSPAALGLLGKVGGTAKAAGAVSVAADTHPIYALNPAFVRDASAPVAAFWYAATTATQGDSAMTVFTAPDPATGAWQPVNVASGNTEARMTTAAKGALVFTEPQVGAWYALTATQVRPLNPSAIKSIGATPISITAYQDLVSHRYSDKLPGTTYNDQGMAGGYDPTTTTTAAQLTSTTHDYIVPIVAGAGALAVAFLLVLRRKLTYND
jgi:hypothetical protein